MPENKGDGKKLYVARHKGKHNKAAAKAEERQIEKRQRRRNAELTDEEFRDMTDEEFWDWYFTPTED